MLGVWSAHDTKTNSPGHSFLHAQTIPDHPALFHSQCTLYQSNANDDKEQADSKHKMDTFWKQNPKFHPFSAPVSRILLNAGSSSCHYYSRHHVDMRAKGLVSTLLIASWAMALPSHDRFFNGTLCERFSPLFSSLWPSIQKESKLKSLNKLNS